MTTTTRNEAWEAAEAVFEKLTSGANGGANFSPTSGTYDIFPDPSATDKVPLPVMDTATYGSSGLRQSGGFLDEEFLPQLRGERARTVYRMMGDNDSTVAAILYTFRTLIESIDWTIKAADDTPEAAKEAEFMEGVLDDMDTSMQSVLSTISTMFQYGFAPLEKLYKWRNGPKSTDPIHRSKFDDGLIGLRGLPLRAQQTIYRWNIDGSTGRILGLWQQPFVGPQLYIPIEKMVLFRTTDEKNNPEGRSLLRGAYRDWYFKTRLEEFEAIGVERELVGIPLIRIPAVYLDSQSSPDQRRIGFQYQQMAAKMKRDKHEGVVMPSDVYQGTQIKQFDIELLGGRGTARIEVGTIIQRHDKGMATSVLADFIFLGQQGTGSFALSSDKTALFSQSLETFLSLICGMWNNDIIPGLWLLNGKDPDLMPTLEHGKIDRANLGELGAYITALAGAGMALFPDRELENSLRKAGNLPEAPEEHADMTDAPPIPTTGPLAQAHIASTQADLLAQQMENQTVTDEDEGGPGVEEPDDSDPKALPPQQRPKPKPGAGGGGQ